MARRIDVELTSSRNDGTWTWRAAGAKQPKGVLDGALLYEGAAVGDIVRAEADFEIDGIFITAVYPPKGKKRSEPDRLEIIGTPREHQGVTTSLVAKSDRPRRDRRDRDRGERGERGDRPDRPARPPRERRDRREPREPRERTGRPPREERPAPPKPKRLVPLNVHRAAVLDALSPEQRPIAEQVLRGGIPAVRQAVETQNATLREQGHPEIKADLLIGMAEELLPRLKAADWRDRAEAAVKEVDEVAIRDLRSVVAGADAVARDDETRLLAGTLREALDRRVAKQRDEWVAEITGCLDDGRLVRALRVSSRPPDPGTRFPAELATRLADAASAAMTPDVLPDRWAVLLDAVASSPVRRQVKPVGLPAEPGEQLLQAAKQASGLVPALAQMLGIEMPPPPPRVAKKARPPRPPRPAPRAKAPAPRPPAATGPSAPVTEPTAEATGDAGPGRPPTGDAGPARPPAPEAAPAVPTAEPVSAAAPEAPTPEASTPEQSTAEAAPEAPAGPASEAPTPEQSTAEAAPEAPAEPAPDAALKAPAREQPTPEPAPAAPTPDVPTGEAAPAAPAPEAAPAAPTAEAAPAAPAPEASPAAAPAAPAPEAAPASEPVSDPATATEPASDADSTTGA